jgi:hypothetical protein
MIRIAFGLLAFLVAIGYAADARAQGTSTIAFAGTDPTWTQAPNRSVSAQVNYTIDPTYTGRIVSIAYYKVTFPGNVRTETIQGFGNTYGPFNGNFSAAWTIGGPGTYCVKGTLGTNKGGVPAPNKVITSADQTLP